MEQSLTIDVNIAGILLAYSIVLIGVLSPGPAVLGIIGTALEQGRKPALLFSFGVVCGSAFWGTVTALGVSAFLIQYAQALYVIKILGGLFLLWLAYKALVSTFSPMPVNASATVAKNNAGKLWLSGLLLHLTNPKGILGWVATIALGVSPGSPAWVSFAIVCGGVLISFLGHAGYAFVFSSVKVVGFYARMRRPIGLIFSALFGAAGLKLLTSRV